jgi:hypothetical protein
MKRISMSLLAAAALAAMASMASAQNLLTINPSFEAGGGFVGGEFPFQDAAAIPGWRLTGVGDGGGFSQILGVTATGNAGQNGQDGFWFAYNVRGVFETLDSARPAISPGTTYRFSFLAEADFNNGPTTGLFSIDWYDSNAGYTPISTTSQLIPIGENGNFSQTALSLIGVAPLAATHAGVRYSTANADTGLPGASAWFDRAALETIAGGTPTWISNASGSYFDPANWLGGNIPNSANATAVFDTPIGVGVRFVYAENNVTLGTLRFNSANTYQLVGTRLTLAGAPTALIDVVSGTPQLNLPVTFAGNANIDTATGTTLLLSNEVTLAPGITLTKNGAGILTFAARVSTTGNAAIRLKGGDVNLDVANTDGNIDINVDPATLNVGANQTLRTLELDAGGNALVVGRRSGGATVNASVTATTLAVINGGAQNIINILKPANSVTTGTLVVDAASSVQKTGPGSLTATLSTINGAYTNASGASTLGTVSGSGAISATGGTVDATRIRVGSLAVTGGAVVSTTPAGGTNELQSLSIGVGGTLNLNTGGLILHNADSAALSASLTAARAAAASWYANGLRNGTGLAVTASEFTTVAVAPNLHSSGLPLFASIGGVSVGNFDVIARYTYIGDTNLDGLLDASDFNAVLSGFTNALTGWENGDVDYSGVVDSADWALFLPAYNFYLASGVPLGDGSTPGQIPEPTSLGILAVAGTMLVRRRR